MNPKLYANPARFEHFRELLMFPRITPSFGKHAGPLTFEQGQQQRDEYLRANRQVLAGFGKHRANRYNSSYNVVEDTARDRLKADRLTRRNAA